MLNIEKAKQNLLDAFLPDFNVVLKNNNKGVITITFTDEDTHGKVNLKFNENTGITTVAPREMDKEEYQARIKQNMEMIKRILNKCNLTKKE